MLNLNREENDLKIFRIVGFLVSLIVLPTVIIFKAIGIDVTNFESWLVLGFFAGALSASSYIIPFVRKYVYEIFYIWLLLSFTFAIYDTVITFDPSNLVVLPTSIYLTVLLPYKNKHNYKFLLAYIFLAEIIFTYYAYANFNIDIANAVIFISFSIIAIVISLTAVLTREKYIQELEISESFVDESPLPFIEIDEEINIIYINEEAEKVFKDLKTRGSKHPIFYKIKKSFLACKESGNKQIQRKIIYESKTLIEKIIYIEEKNTFRIYINDISAFSRSESILATTKAKLEKQQIALINLLEDLSQEKEYAFSQSQVLLETLGEGVVVTDDEGKITYTNPAFKMLFGIGEEIYGKDIAEALIAYDLNGKPLPITTLTNSAALTADNSEFKVNLENANKEKIPVLINSAPINVKGEFKGVVRVLHDFSEDLKIQQQKDDFFSIASHELRTPLTVISGNLDIILQGYGNSKLSKDDSILLQDTVTAADRLIRMVNDFLSVSRLDQGRLETKLDLIDPCAIAKSVIKELKPLATDKAIELTYLCDKKHKMVMADEALLNQIIINLTGNAIKFTSKGGVTVKNTVENNNCVIRVTDSGIGIEEDKMQLLFHKFQQVMGRTLQRQAGGTGLGLYISREFARKMGGDLVLEKTEFGKGSTFMLTLPAVEPKKTS